MADEETTTDVPGAMSTADGPVATPVAKPKEGDVKVAEDAGETPGRPDELNVPKETIVEEVEKENNTPG